MKRYGWQKRLQPQTDNQTKTMSSQSPSNTPTSQYQQQQKHSQKQRDSLSPFNISQPLKNAVKQAPQKMSKIKNLSEISPHVFFQGMDSLVESKQKKQNYSRASSRASSSKTAMRNRLQKIENGRDSDGKQMKQIGDNLVQQNDLSLKITGMKIALDKIQLQQTRFVSKTERKKQQAQNHDIKSGSKTQRTVNLINSNGESDRINNQIISKGAYKSKNIVEKQRKQKQPIQFSKTKKTSNIICLYLKKYYKKQIGSVFYDLSKHKEKFNNRFKKYSIVLKKLNSKFFNQHQQSCLKFFKLLTHKICYKQLSTFFESVKVVFPKIVHILYKRQLRSAFNQMKHREKKNFLPLLNGVLRYSQTLKLKGFKKIRNYSSVHKNSKQISALTFMHFYKTKLHRILFMSLCRILGTRVKADLEQVTQIDHSSYLSPVRQRGIKRNDDHLVFSQSKKKIENFNKPVNRKTTLAEDTIGLRLEKQVKEEDKQFQKQKNNMEFRIEQLKQIISEYNFQLSFKQRAQQELKIIVKSLDSGSELKNEVFVKQQSKKSELTQIYFKIDKMPENIEVSSLQELIKVNDPNGQNEKLVQLWIEVFKGRQLHKKISAFQKKFQLKNQLEVEVIKEGSAKKFAIKQEKILKELFCSYVKEQYLWHHVGILAESYC